ncbi:Trm112 family protein [Georgenia sp. Z1344]|uniref:Trm112 family protein n=1 Tax=Georgenia sp. Z1344 TaxID=3416706 RepID=UPI003CF2C8AD
MTHDESVGRDGQEQALRGKAAQEPTDRPVAQAVRADGVTVGGGELEPWVRALLRCPVTGDELTDAVAPDGTAELRSAAAGLAYPVRDGVPILLEDEARSL